MKTAATASAMEARKKEARKTTPLVGRFFHSIKKGEIQWQGRVEAEVSPGLFLVQLFSWLTGTATDQILVSVSKMKGWKFYNSADEMQEAYDRNQKY